MNNSLIEKQK